MFYSCIIKLVYPVYARIIYLNQSNFWACTIWRIDEITN